MDSMHGFGSLALGSRLRRLSERLIQEVSAIYQHQGITLQPACFPLFNLLYQQGQLSVTQAAQHLQVSHPAISKLAGKLAAQGWLNKTTDPHDERRQLLQLTPQGTDLALRIQPIWQAIHAQVDTLQMQLQHPLLAALDEFEQSLKQHGLAQPVLSRLQPPPAREEVSIIGWDSRYRADFKSLNLSWLEGYFNGQLTTLDQQALTNPEAFYLARGGYIWLARHHQESIGCIALAQHDHGRYEIAKMAVSPSFQGAGVGRQLLLVALTKARQLGAREVYLETASCLKRALRLYRHVGFRAVPHPNGGSLYPRSDLYLTLTLVEQS